ncbi:MAG: serine hydrolase domain-containing protein [Cyclobacteriaceae bacterium]
MRMRFCLVLIISLMGCTTPPSNEYEKKTDLESILDEFEYQLQKDLQDDNLNGSFSVVIVKGEEIIRSKTYGQLDFKNTPANANSIYRIGSISKSFTAFLMMQLIQDGIFELDDPIEKYLPEIRQLREYSDSTIITFRQLASHTSGLNSGPDLGRPSTSAIQEWESEVLACIPATGFRSRPGKSYSYSNIGFAFLGYAIARAAGEPYIELIQKRILDPLQMSSTYFQVPEEKQADLAQGRWGGPMGGYDEDRPKKEHEGTGWSVPNGGIYSTANNLAKFMICSMGYSELLSDDNLALMQTMQTPEGKWHENYGLGFTLYKDSIISTIGHQGGNPGYRANMLFEKESQYGVVILRNYSWGLTDLNLKSTILLRKLKELSLEEVE